jgi:hypothetical protein
MREPADLERDMISAVAALDRAVEFLTRYDRVRTGASHLLPDGNGDRSALTDCAEEGLAAARRVLGDLRSAPPPRIPRQRVGDYGHGDPGE